MLVFSLLFVALVSSGALVIKPVEPMVWMLSTSMMKVLPVDETVWKGLTVSDNSLEGCWNARQVVGFEYSDMQSTKTYQHG